MHVSSFWQAHTSRSMQDQTDSFTSGVTKPRRRHSISSALFAMSGTKGQTTDGGRRTMRGELTIMPNARTNCAIHGLISGIEHAVTISFDSAA